MLSVDNMNASMSERESWVQVVSWPMRKFRVSKVTATEPNPPEISV
jgi:hypothetical protein